MEIIAHRGASRDAPENTLAAVRLAWTQGADAVEIDVRRTADGRFAVIHDANTRRTARGARAVSRTPMAALDRLEIKSATYPGEKIPVLEDVLALVPARGRIFVEVKDGPEVVPALAASLAARRMGDRGVIISFDYDAACAAKKIRPTSPVAWIVDRPKRTRGPTLDWLIERCQRGKLNGLDLAWRWPIDAEFVERVHRAGLKLYVWTVDHPATARRLQRAGVDGITTNRPGWLRERLADRENHR